MHSAIYEGWVRHRRTQPCVNNFQYPLFMVYADLDELDAVFNCGLWSTRRFNVAWFCRSDYMKSRPSGDLAKTVRDVVEERTGQRPCGPIRLLTHFRYFGIGMNPVSFYYCFDRTGTQVDAIIAEINNTPWGEQHAYVLHRTKSTQTGNVLRFEFLKTFHVSPFMPMNVDYRWRFSPPGDSLTVYMENASNTESFFDATLVLRRTELSSRRLTLQLLRFPLATLQVVARIYWQALNLWWKKVPFFEHPKHQIKESNVYASGIPPARVRIGSAESSAALHDAHPAKSGSVPIEVAAIGKPRSD